jgi:hypothetical protein
VDAVNNKWTIYGLGADQLIGSTELGYMVRIKRCCMITYLRDIGLTRNDVEREQLKPLCQLDSQFPDQRMSRFRAGD